MKVNIYCIIKELILPNNVKQNVILVDSLSEIIEFDNKDEAQNLADIFQSNSDSGYKYYIKKIV
jgi:archaellum biogenesis ATPase FlaH